MTGDPNQEYLADGISENITTALSKIPDIFVIDQHSALSFKEKSVKVKQIAEELGVQYLVEGSLQKAGERLQLTTRIVDALAGRNLWANSFKKDLNNIFDAQDEITINILKIIHVKSISGSDAEFALGTKSIEAMNYVRKGIDHALRRICKDDEKAVEFFKKALEIDPGYAAAWAELAWVYHDAPKRWCLTGRMGMKSMEIRKLRGECLAKALEIDFNNPLAQTLHALIYREDGQYEIAIKQLENAIMKNPNSAELCFRLGEVLAGAGRAQEGIALIERAIRLNPFYPWYYLSGLSTSYFLLQQYDNGVQIAEQLLDRGKKEGHKDMIRNGHMYCAINLVELGQIEQAQAHMKEYLKVKPGIIVNNLEAWYRDRIQNPADLERMLSAMHKAGMPRY
jgi:adenylate cyclase